MILTPIRRELMHAVMDGDTELSGVMFILNQYTHCDAFLRFLLVNKITGNNLRELLVKKYKGRVEPLVKFIVQKSKERQNDART